MTDKFNLYSNIDFNRLEKSFVLEGIASTPIKDADGEYLLPSGLDFSEFTNGGTVNWQHKKKGVAQSVGFPVGAKFIKKGEVLPNGELADTDLWWASVELYDNLPFAQDIVKLAQAMKNSNNGNSLAFSIEGDVISRDPVNPKIVTAGKITGIAITPTPKNFDSTVSLIEKGFEITPNSEFDCVVDVTDPETGERIVVDRNYDIIVIPAKDKDSEKALTTASVAPLTKEDLKGSNINTNNKPKVKMTKAVSDAIEKAMQNLEAESDIEKACAPKDNTIEKTSKKKKSDDEDEDEDDMEPMDMPENGKEPEQKVMKLKKSFTAQELGCENESDMDAVILEAQKISKLKKSVTSDGVFYEEVEEPIVKAVTSNNKSVESQKYILKAVEAVGNSLDVIQKSFDAQITKLIEVNETLSKRIEQIENEPNLRKSFVSSKAIERFKMASDNDGRTQLGTITHKDKILKAIETLAIDENKQIKDPKLLQDLGAYNNFRTLTDYSIDVLSKNGIEIIKE